MSRRQGREVALQGLYQLDLVKNPLREVISFKWYNKALEPEIRFMAEQLINGVVNQWDKIDKIISAYSINRKLDEISVINRCILRLSIYSLINQREISPKIVIDEALELTREFETENSVSFINGILDSIYKDSINSLGDD